MKHILLLTLLGLALYPIHDALALRCEGGLVDVGADKAAVLMRCGSPVSTGIVGVETITGRNGNSLATVELPLERWAYDFGENAFLQLLTFRGNLLVSIENGDRVSSRGGNAGRLIAAIGDTSAEVRMKNGEPFLEEFAGSEIETQSLVAGLQEHEIRNVELPIERWTYRIGPGRFMQILTFRGGRLESIENGARE